MATFYDQVLQQPEIGVVREQYLSKGVNFAPIFKKHLDRATEDISNPDLRDTARRVAGYLIDELTECIGKRLATKQPTTTGGKIRFWLANIFWPQPKI